MPEFVMGIYEVVYQAGEAPAPAEQLSVFDRISHRPPHSRALLNAYFNHMWQNWDIDRLILLGERHGLDQNLLRESPFDFLRELDEVSNLRPKITIEVSFSDTEENRIVLGTAQTRSHIHLVRKDWKTAGTQILEYFESFQFESQGNVLLLDGIEVGSVSIPGAPSARRARYIARIDHSQSPVGSDCRRRDTIANPAGYRRASIKNSAPFRIRGFIWK